MIEDWIENNIDSQMKYTGNGKEVHVCCPVCEETRYRLYVNLENGSCYCHNCGWKSATITGLIQWVEGVSWTKAINITKEIKGNLYIPDNISDELEKNIFSEDLRKSLKKRAIPLPEEYRIIDPYSDNNNLSVKRAIKYLHSRKITNKQITAHKFGFCQSGEYKNRVIIPITEDGELRFWVARAISKSEKLKEKSPSDEEWNISKSEVIFNIDNAAKKYHCAVISEGIFDSLSWGDIGVSLLGKSLYEEQLNILLDYRNLLTEGLYIAVDYDAMDKATEMAETLSQFFKVKIINIPQEFDDPNNYLQTHDRKAMWKLIENAEEYSEFSKLKRLFM